jgi:hypothetical protein
MLSLFEIILDIGEIFLSWRLYVAIALTGLVIWGVIGLVSDQTARWVTCVPLGIVGFAVGFYWQVRAAFK